MSRFLLRRGLLDGTSDARGHLYLRDGGEVHTLAVGPGVRPSAVARELSGDECEVTIARAGAVDDEVVAAVTSWREAVVRLAMGGTLDADAEALVAAGLGPVVSLSKSIADLRRRVASAEREIGAGRLDASRLRADLDAAREECAALREQLTSATATATAERTEAAYQGRRASAAVDVVALLSTWASAAARGELTAEEPTSAEIPDEDVRTWAVDVYAALCDAHHAARQRAERAVVVEGAARRTTPLSALIVDDAHGNECARLWLAGCALAAGERVRVVVERLRPRGQGAEGAGEQDAGVADHQQQAGEGGGVHGPTIAPGAGAREVP